ncbi:MAG: YdcF family protein [Ferruginibacter sp.]|nr:YdcF family protein [Cytophagales bacterium]
MFFVLSKTLLYALMPITWVMGALLYARFTRDERQRKRWLGIGIGMVFLFGNGFLINEALLQWEIPPTPLAEIRQPYDVAIVLTGITNSTKQPRDRVYFEKGADRITHALHLYKLGKVRKILISGGSGLLTGRGGSESDELASFLRLCGVPERDVVVETRSRNTRENALFSAQLLRRHFPNQRYLLVTSAFHLRRAAGCFRQAGVRADGFSADFQTAERTFTPDRWLIPSEGAFGKWSLLLHEMTGYAVYKLMGYC